MVGQRDKSSSQEHGERGLVQDLLALLEGKRTLLDHELLMF